MNAIPQEKKPIDLRVASLADLEGLIERHRDARDDAEEVLSDIKRELSRRREELEDLERECDRRRWDIPFMTWEELTHGGGDCDGR